MHCKLQRLHTCSIGPRTAELYLACRDYRTLDHEEMKEALLKMGLFTTQQNFDILFRQLDKDSSGTLDFEVKT